jgi:uncharacterized protein (TIGR03437 family)
MKHTLLTALLLVGSAHTQTITGVIGEAGNAALSPGGIAFVQGTGLGNSTSISVKVGTRSAYVFNAFGTSLQVQLPVDAPVGATTITAGNSAAFNITLGQYSPGIPVDNGVAAIHNSSGRQVTASFPAAPNEQITIGATGLGATNPVFATGTAPTDTSAKVVTVPTLNFAGSPIPINGAFLQPNSPGFYGVVFTVPANATTGNKNVTLSIGGLTSNTVSIPVSTGPIVSAAVNAATYRDMALPGAGLAPGSIAILQGVNMGPAKLSIADKAFQSKTLSGTSVSMNINGTNYDGLMYYTSASQVAFLVPSNTPSGSGTVTVTYNGQAGPAAPFRIGLNNPGIFTVTSDGQGPGIITFADYSLVSSAKAANCGGVYTTCGAANPGDALIIWATGLGPITGSDAAGDGLGVNMSSIPLTLWIGNVQVTPVYQGRSGCCIGEDQIVFVVPANAPTGCRVPLSIQINNYVSNSVPLPIAPAGGRTCTPSDPAYTTSQVVQLSTGTDPVTYGEIDLSRDDNFPGVKDRLAAQFLRVVPAPAAQPFFMAWVDQLPLGTCEIIPNLQNSSDPPLSLVAPLDAGPQIAIQGPNGSRTVNASNGGYGSVINSNGAPYYVSGAYTITSPGGKEVPAFTVPLTIPSIATMTSPPPDAANPVTVTRANGLTVTWTGGAPSGFISIDGSSATDGSFNTGVSFHCLAPAAAGSFTIPANILLALPTGNFGRLDFQPAFSLGNLSGTGLNVSKIVAAFDTFTPLQFR